MKLYIGDFPIGQPNIKWHADRFILYTSPNNDALVMYSQNKRWFLTIVYYDSFVPNSLLVASNVALVPHKNKYTYAKGTLVFLFSSHWDTVMGEKMMFPVFSSITTRGGEFLTWERTQILVGDSLFVVAKIYNSTIYSYGLTPRVTISDNIIGGVLNHYWAEFTVTPNSILIRHEKLRFILPPRLLRWFFFNTVYTETLVELLRSEYYGKTATFATRIIKLVNEIENLAKS